MLENKDLLENQMIRNLIYNILITNIDGSKIIRDLVIELCNSNTIKEEDKFKIIEESTKYEYNLLRGRHEIMHLEGFVMAIFNIIK